MRAEDGVAVGDLNHNKMNNMEKLHHDIVLNILLRLPHQCIINCKLVCKPWRHLLRHTEIGLLFVVGKLGWKRLCHGGQQQFDEIDMNGHYSHIALVEMGHPPALPQVSLSAIVGSCNGLVCVLVKNQDTYLDEPIYIYNPISQEHVYLPQYKYSDEAHYTDDHFETSFICGFGYTYSTDEYKVVRIRTRFSQPVGESSHVQVYTLGSGLGWRDKERVWLDAESNLGCCANGSLHWIDGSKEKVMAFDLALEKFILFPLPPPLRLFERIPGSVSLKLLGGYLSLIHVNRDFVNIWSLKKKKKCNGYNTGEDEFDDFWSWDKEFCIPWDDTKLGMFTMYEPFAVTKKNQVLLWFNEVLSCYDPETKTLTKLWDDSSKMLWVQAIPHFYGLVSLEALGEKSNKSLTNVLMHKFNSFY